MTSEVSAVHTAVVHKPFLVHKQLCGFSVIVVVSLKVRKSCTRISAAREEGKKGANLFKGNCQLYIKVLHCVLCSFATYAREIGRRKCSVEAFAALQGAVQIQIN